MSEEYLVRVDRLLQELGVSPEMIVRRGLPLFREPGELVPSGEYAEARDLLLVPEAALAWRRLAAAAAQDNAHLLIVSAFRSVERQAEIVRAKLRSGISIEQILRSSAPPGYSEHHSGRAVDLATHGCPPLEEEFENTAAFEWLSMHGESFGFTLSFPRGNKYGYHYEPWHWYCRETA